MAKNKYFAVRLLGFENRTVGDITREFPFFQNLYAVSYRERANRSEKRN